VRRQRRIAPTASLNMLTSKTATAQYPGTQRVKIPKKSVAASRYCIELCSLTRSGPKPHAPTENGFWAVPPDGGCGDVVQLN
jgi:hypothetical protein